MKKYLCLLVLFLSFLSCQRYLYVQQERIDKNFLAGSHVKTPDPNQKHPPKGEKINVYWNFPLYLYKQELSLHLTVRFWNNTEKKILFPITRIRDMTSFFFSRYDMEKVLTYKIDVITKEEKIVYKCKHQLWKELIVVSEDPDTPK